MVPRLQVHGGRLEATAAWRDAGYSGIWSNAVLKATAARREAGRCGGYSCMDGSKPGINATAAWKVWPGMEATAGIYLIVCSGDSFVGRSDAFNLRMGSMPLGGCTREINKYQER